MTKINLKSSKFWVEEKKTNVQNTVNGKCKWSSVC